MTDNFQTFSFKNTHYLLKEFYTPEFINDIYQEILPLYSSSHVDTFMSHQKLNHTIQGNYNYIINSNNIRNFDKFQKILNDFNNHLKNCLIEHNNSFVKKKFNINLSDVNLCITRKGTLPTEIIKTKHINIFIPLHTFPNGGAVSILPSTIEDTNINDIMDKYYNIDDVNHVINYGKLSDYDTEDRDKLLNQEIYIDSVPGDVLIVNKNIFSRSLPNMTNEDRYCLQLIYDLSV